MYFVYIYKSTFFFFRFFFVCLQWHASAGLVAQTLCITLQKPLLVAELGFLLSVTKFVIPNFAFIQSTPLPFASMDVVLSGNGLDREPYKAAGDLWLSPSVRLLADAPGDTTSFEYDGCNHRIYLPSREHLDELLPLIIVGSGRTLRLKNVTLVNADSLPACLQLAAGAQLICQSQDGVTMINSSDSSHKLPKSPGSPRLSGGHEATDKAASKCELSPPGQGGGEAIVETLSRDTSAPSSSISISIDAVGVGLHLMQLEGAEGSPQQIRELGAGSRSSSAEGLSAAAASLHKHPSHSDVFGRRQEKSVAAPQLQSRSIRLLAATMDVGAWYERSGLRQTGRLEIQGLRAQTRKILDAGRVMEDRETKDLAEHRKLKGQKEGTVLQPCRLVLDFDLLSVQGPGDESAQVIRTDLSVEASEVQISLSPGTLELTLQLGEAALAPLMQPGVDAALRASSQFQRVWSFDPGALWKENTEERAVSLSATGIGVGVTVWRPQTATGYGITGHVITPGDESPAFEVLTVAVNSGIAAYPASYRKVWSGGGASIWRPVPPEGYTAVGDVVMLGTREPELSEVLCLHGKGSCD